jgi:hypothetical protein
MNRRLIQVAVATIVTASILAGPSVAGAATTGGDPGAAYGVTATLSDQGSLLGNVIVTVPIEVTCTPQNGWGPNEPNQGMSFLSITQAVSKKAVARGSAFLSGPVCDGSAHTYELSFPLEYTSTVPFKKGSAVVSGQIQACGFNPDTFEFGCGQASVGPQLIRIR